MEIQTQKEKDSSVTNEINFRITKQCPKAQWSFTLAFSLKYYKVWHIIPHLLLIILPLCLLKLQQLAWISHFSYLCIRMHIHIRRSIRKRKRYSQVQDREEWQDAAWCKTDIILTTALKLLQLQGFLHMKFCLGFAGILGFIFTWNQLVSVLVKTLAI